jgi:hypothetical protein
MSQNLNRKEQTFCIIASMQQPRKIPEKEASDKLSVTITMLVPTSTIVSNLAVLLALLIDLQSRDAEKTSAFQTS